MHNIVHNNLFNPNYSVFIANGVRTQLFIAARKDTVSSTVNQIPATLVKQRPSAVNLNVPIPVHVQPVHVQPVPVQPVHVPVHGAPQLNIAKPSTPQEMNKLFNEMKNSKKPFMTITMKGPPKESSLFPDPFNLFSDDNRYLCVHRDKNAHTIQRAQKLKKKKQ